MDHYLESSTILPTSFFSWLLVRAIHPGAHMKNSNLIRLVYLMKRYPSLVFV
jgi:hypothetical protein